MNYVQDRTVPVCICCGAELLPDVGEDATGMACDGCFRESEAKAAQARQAEAADEFRWMSREWFKTSRVGVMMRWDEFEKRNRALPAEEQVD